MKKLYSKKLGGEAFALDAAQLDTLKKAGYTVPSPEEVIADAAAVKIEPPEGKRAYVVFDFKTGAFKVRTRTQTLAESEVGGFVGEVVSAAILCGFVERADMDKPKADAPATPTTASPLVNMRGFAANNREHYYNSMLDVLDLAYLTVNHEKIPPNVLKEWVKLITDELSQISKIKRSDKARA